MRMVFEAVEGGETAPVVVPPVVPSSPVPATALSWMLEAAAGGSLDDRMQCVRNAVRTKYGDTPGEYTYVDQVWDTFVIVRCGQKLWKISYTVSGDGTVTLSGDKQQVRYEPVPVTEDTRGDDVFLTMFGPVAEESASYQFVDEATGQPAQRPTGRQWGVIVIQEGMSKNRRNYVRKAIAEGAHLYEGAPMYSNHRKPGPFGRDREDKLGFLKNVRPVMLTPKGATESTSASVFALAGTACVTNKVFREEMLDAWEMGDHDYMGVSHHAGVESHVVHAQPFAYEEITKIGVVGSVDWVLNPAAGGRLVSVVASDTPSATLAREAMLLTKMIEAIKGSGNAALIKKFEAFGASPTEDQILSLYSEAFAQPAGAGAGAGGGTSSAAAAAVATPTQVAATSVTAAMENYVTQDQILELRRENLTARVDAAVAGTGLPQLARDRFAKRFKARIAEATQISTLPTNEQMTRELAEEVEHWGGLVQANLVVPSSRPRIEVGDRRKKVDEALDAFFDPTKTPTSFKELYIGITGDTKVTGRVTEATRLSEIVESLSSTTFGEILGDSITRRMLAAYTAFQDLQNWRNTIATTVPLSDFRQQRRTRMGGYSNLPIVGERAPYPALTSPTDEEATYVPAKRGGIESVSIEMIKNDDVGVIRRIPGALANAAAFTLHEFVWGFLENNNTVYDAVALAAVGHGNNIITTALTSSNITTARLRMKQQTEMGSGRRVPIKAKYLIVPSELEDLAFQLTQANVMLPDSGLAAQAASGAPNPIRRYSLTPLTVDYWTDANNWWVAASVDQLPMIEVGFMDGREEPELWVQEAPTVGSLFTHDVITWKIRHIYGAVVNDYRGFVGGIVP
jgi:hypothetical protein